MNPRIVAISGPLKGSVFPLGEDDLRIGRDPRGDVYLDDLVVSRRHCTISYGEGGYTVLDLRSVIGTFVNGFCFPVKDLAHGDRIRVGGSTFVYLDRDEIPPSGLEDGGENWNSSASSGERVPSYEAAKTTVLDAFLRINASINGIRSVEEIQARVFELIFQVIPAQRAAILQAGHDQNRFVSVTYSRNGSRNDEPFDIDEAMTSKVLREGAPAYRDQAICGPLTAFDTRVGVIYAAEAASRWAFFTSAHMKLLASIGGFTAVALEHARYVGWLEGENRRLTEAINVEHGMVGQSAKMKEVYQFVGRAGPAGPPVLILGGSGTGKELVAHAIHRNSPRSGKGFFAANCGAFVETLLESELFGHEKGAFTGAATQRKGLFELADGGTLFLDEIGELPMTMQSDLLRVLQNGEFKRLGGDRTIRVDVRVIAATNRDLQKAIREGRFRQDLFFRLDVLSIEMPPLSERREDIPLLAAHFIKRRRHMRPGPHPPVLGISPEANHLLAVYSWPGNVRELENAIERAIALGVSPYIQPEDLPKTLRTNNPDPGDTDVYDKELDAFRKSLFERVLQQARGNRLDAARRLGLHPTYFARLCRDLNVKSGDPHGAPKSRLRT